MYEHKATDDSSGLVPVAGGVAAAGAGGAGAGVAAGVAAAAAAVPVKKNSIIVMKTCQWVDTLTRTAMGHQRKNKEGGNLLLLPVEW